MEQGASLATHPFPHLRGLLLLLFPLQPGQLLLPLLLPAALLRPPPLLFDTLLFQELSKQLARLPTTLKLGGEEYTVDLSFLV